MKILTNKQYNNLLDNIAILNKELSQARDLKEILNKFSGITFNGEYLQATGGTIGWKSAGFELSDNVLVYVDDILGGKVIKQEGTKCLVVDKDGNIKEGLTKQKADQGYTYKLVRNGKTTS